MPLFKEWNIGDHGLAAIWKIEEPEGFFAGPTGLSPDIKNEKRRMEHLAGRWLLQFLKEDFPLHHIARDAHDKPRLANNEYYFSISHSWPYVAAVVDDSREAGIDIQTWHPRIQQIQHKFLSDKEQQIFQNDSRLIILAWCAKEAAYKWNGRRGVDFIEHLPIVKFDNKPDEINIDINLNVPDLHKKLFISNVLSDDFACSYISGFTLPHWFI